MPHVRPEPYDPLKVARREAVRPVVDAQEVTATERRARAIGRLLHYVYQHSRDDLSVTIEHVHEDEDTEEAYPLAEEFFSIMDACLRTQMRTNHTAKTGRVLKRPIFPVLPVWFVRSRREVSDHPGGP